MGCALQIGLFLLGCGLVSRSRVKLGTQELRAPFTIFVGLILTLQLPLAIGIGVALGGVEGIKAQRTGVEPAVAQERFVKKYWWLDVAIPGTAALLATGIAIAGARPPLLLPPPPDEPIGIRDFRATAAAQWDDNARVLFDDEKEAVS